MIVIVSPLMNTVPSFRFISPSILSSASWSTVFICMSKDIRLPMYCLPFFSSTSTLLPRALFRASSGLAGSIKFHLFWVV